MTKDEREYFTQRLDTLIHDKIVNLVKIWGHAPTPQDTFDAIKAAIKDGRLKSPFMTRKSMTTFVDHMIEIDQTTLLCNMLRTLTNTSAKEWNDMFPDTTWDVRAYVCNVLYFGYHQRRVLPQAIKSNPVLQADIDALLDERQNLLDRAYLDRSAALELLESVK